PLNVEIASRNLGWEMMAAGDWGSALQEAHSALSVAKNIPDHEGEFSCLMLLMNLYGDRRSTIKDFDKAFEAYADLKKLVQAHSELDLADSAYILTEIYWQMDRNADAATSARQAVAYYEKDKNDSYNQAHS